MQTVIVTDQVEFWSYLNKHVLILDASDYLEKNYHFVEPSIRIINLCRSYEYQTIGYYVSLLAQAREHKTIPSALNIQDLHNNKLSKEIFADLDDEIQSTFKSLKTDSFTFSLYFGKNLAKKYDALAKKLHGLFPLPLIKFELNKKKKWKIKQITKLSTEEIPESHLDFMREVSIEFLSKKRYHQWNKKKRHHDLAILYDPDELNAPSDEKALSNFIRAGEDLDINVELIEKHDGKFIAEYDALFIRATTAVDNFTYRFSRKAFQENMVVIDDPQSIVKCTNKVYLAELLKSHGVATPETVFLNKYDKILPELTFPSVLKIPDGSFSHGVVKLNNVDELNKALDQFFKSSDLVLIQPFIKTDFDWRIGILDNQPLFACRYYMAKNHWQIYNWKDTKNVEGPVETFDLDDVPKEAIRIALKATKLIGDGLYGVDLKLNDGKYYVIEVNDNPSIESGCEDLVLGQSLYHKIMSLLLHRIRRKHGYV